MTRVSTEGDFHCKIVYWGPPGSGKSASLQALGRALPESCCGQVSSLSDSQQSPKNYFEQVRIDLPAEGKRRIRFHVYTVPAWRETGLAQSILRDVDGVVFVADSSVSQVAQNLESLAELEDQLSLSGRGQADVPLAFQWNKSDLDEALPADERNAYLNPLGRPSQTTVATAGEGVVAALKLVMTEVLEGVFREHGVKVAPPPRRSRLAERQPREQPEPVGATEGPPRQRFEVHGVKPSGRFRRLLAAVVPL